MGILRVGAQVIVCENHTHNDRNWKDVTGYVLMITRKTVTISTSHGQINLPRNKVVAV
ncbi:hypothetical protein SEA_STIGMA_137 [Streptomyces phage Stigma]|nr:hypothetical protein SEA_STIGMA_137 [Streptomyces phage Stigma]